MEQSSSRGCAGRQRRTSDHRVSKGRGSSGGRRRVFTEVSLRRAVEDRHQERSRGAEALRLILLVGEVLEPHIGWYRQYGRDGRRGRRRAFLQSEARCLAARDVDHLRRGQLPRVPLLARVRYAPPSASTASLTGLVEPARGRKDRAGGAVGRGYGGIDTPSRQYRGYGNSIY